MQFGHKVAPLPLQTLAQQVGKEMVVAVPAPLTVQRDNEKVAGIEGLQDRLAINLPSHGRSTGTAWRLGFAESHCVTQRPGQAVQDGSLQQECP